MAARIETLITRMEKSRAQLDAALEKLAPQQDIYPTWKVKQVMDHITGWDELVDRALQAYSTGLIPNTMKESIDQYNVKSTALRKELSFEQSQQDYHVARQILLKRLRELPQEMLDREYPAPWGGTCTVKEIVKIFSAHEREHARHIEDILKASTD
jgi:hypothetical protein